MRVSGTEKGDCSKFHPNYFAKNPGAYGRGPFSSKQTVEHHLHSQRSDLGVVYMTYKLGLDRRLESSSVTHPRRLCLCAQSRA